MERIEKEKKKKEGIIYIRERGGKELKKKKGDVKKKGKEKERAKNKRKRKTIKDKKNKKNCHDGHGYTSTAKGLQMQSRIFAVARGKIVTSSPQSTAGLSLQSTHKVRTK